MGALFIDGIRMPDPFRDWPVPPISEADQAHAAAREARFEDAMQTALRQIAEVMPPVVQQAAADRAARCASNARQAVAA